MEDCQVRFARFYGNKHNNRRLQWLY